MVRTWRVPPTSIRRRLLQPLPPGLRARRTWVREQPSRNRKSPWRCDSSWQQQPLQPAGGSRPRGPSEQAPFAPRRRDRRSPRHTASPGHARSEAPRSTGLFRQKGECPQAYEGWRVGDTPEQLVESRQSRGQHQPIATRPRQNGTRPGCGTATDVSPIERLDVSPVSGSKALVQAVTTVSFERKGSTFAEVRLVLPSIDTRTFLFSNVRTRETRGASCPDHE